MDEVVRELAVFQRGDERRAVECIAADDFDAGRDAGDQILGPACDRAHRESRVEQRTRPAGREVSLKRGDYTGRGVRSEAALDPPGMGKRCSGGVLGYNARLPGWGRPASAFLVALSDSVRRARVVLR